MMKPNSTPTYPAADDISYAVWLKNLAIKLPDYTRRYQLTRSKVLEMHCLALDYIELLVDRMHQTTAHICLGDKHPVTKELDDANRAILIREIANQLVTHIMDHASYTAADAHELCLPPPGHPPGSSRRFPHSPTNA